MANQAIVVVNAGSSSIKFSLYTLDQGALTLDSKGQIEGIGVHPHFVAERNGLKTEQHWEVDPPGQGHLAGLQRLRDWLQSQLHEIQPVAVGHRVVHGGEKYDRPVVVTDEITRDLKALVSLAPLHQPHSLAGLQAMREIFPELPQAACFDTAFHRSHEKVAEVFAIPYEYYEQGVKRYGFHGLSYEYITQALPKVAPEIAMGKVVVAHLGSGASMCAIDQGKSVDSTMGFTALDGLPMGTRCGNIDPGVLLYLMTEKQLSAKAIESLLYKESGLKGISGISNDMRDLQASPDPRAALAIDYFIYRINREIGALAAAMNGLDGLVFTAGIGERSVMLRERVLDQARWLGFHRDDDANQQHGPRITSPTSPKPAYVIPTDEERMIARHTLKFL